MERVDATQPRYIKVRVSVLVVIAAVLAVVITAAGFVHVVRGAKVHRWLGVQVCAKEGWALGNTFMNTDDYLGQPRLVAALDDHVVAALIHCGVLHIHPSLPPADELTASGLTANM
jgi:hypothetical protein